MEKREERGGGGRWEIEAGRRDTVKEWGFEGEAFLDQQ